MKKQSTKFKRGPKDKLIKPARGNTLGNISIDDFKIETIIEDLKISNDIDEEYDN